MSKEALPIGVDARLPIVYAEVRDQVDGQLHLIEAHDQKAGILLALSGGIAVFLLAFALGADDLGRRGHAELTLLIEAGIATLASIASAYAGLWPREWRRDPNPTALIDAYEAGRYRDADALLRELTSNLRESYLRNVGGIQAKTRRLKQSQLALGVALVLSILTDLADVFGW
jgi:hypothetical protein